MTRKQIYYTIFRNKYIYIWYGFHRADRGLVVFNREATMLEQMSKIKFRRFVYIENFIKHESLFINTDNLESKILFHLDKKKFFKNSLNKLTL